MTTKRYSLAFSGFFFLVFLLLWQIISSAPLVSFTFGSPVAIGRVLFENTVNGLLPSYALITGAEALLGFFIGVSFGTFLGFSFWYSPFLGTLVGPYIFVLGAVPVFTFAPIVIVWFGIGFEMKVALATLGTFLISLTQAYEGARAVDEDQLRLLRILAATRLQVLQKVILPSSLSWIFNAMKLNVNASLLGAFLGEFISADRGIGFFMIRAGSLYDVPAVFAGGVYLILLALLFHSAVVFLEENKLAVIGFCSVSRKVRLASIKIP